MSKPNDAILIPGRLVGHVREEALPQLGIVARRVSEAVESLNPDPGHFTGLLARLDAWRQLLDETGWPAAPGPDIAIDKRHRVALRNALRDQVVTMRLAPIPLSLRPRSHWQERASASARSGA
jgi:hypothetical protein